MNTLTADVVIVGAGIVGSALACALGGSKLKVVVLEAQSLSTQWPEQNDTVAGFDPRVSALTLASQHFLTELLAWSAVIDRRASVYRDMHVWDAEGTGSIHFSAEEIQQPALGHIVENRVIATALLQQLQTHNNIQCVDGSPLKAITTLNDSGAYQLQLEGGRTINAALVVAADGANSFVRQQFNVPMREWDYGHDAIVATVQTERPHQQAAWQRFLPEGPLAFLPLRTGEGDQHLCSIVWSAIPQYAENLMALNDEEFCQQLAAAFEHQLGAVTTVSRRFCIPLRQRHAIDYVQPGLALVGDAAHTIHPLAGQGVNLGLSDAQVLAEELLRASERGLQPGSLHVLKRFQRRRKSENLMMMSAMEGFKRLFAEPALPVRWARNTGMRWLDGASPLKRRIMRAAMGVQI